MYSSPSWFFLQALICAVKVKNNRQFGGSAGYRFDFGLPVLVSVQKSDNNFQDDWTSYDFYSQYDFGNNVVRAAYFNAENEKGSEQKTDGWIVGFDHAFSERTLFWRRVWRQQHQRPVQSETGRA